MPLRLTPALNLTEKEIRYAMDNTLSNSAAARFLGCTAPTYKKYAVLYIDEESGKNLWDLHTNVSGKGLHKNTGKHFIKSIFEILEGKHPNYNRQKLARRLLDEKLFPEECGECGFSEKRITDYNIPLLMAAKDGNPKNLLKDNLIFVCYNCYFLMYADKFAVKPGFVYNILQKK